MYRGYASGPRCENRAGPRTVSASELHEERAEYLATVFLTRYAGVEVSRNHSGGFDLHVNIREKGRSVGRVFGIELKSCDSLARVGRVGPSNTLTVHPELRSQLQMQQRRLRLLPFPLLFLIVEMQWDRGFYGWLREPLNERQLGSPKVAKATRWGPDSHVEIIDRVKNWYVLDGGGS
jgi:hypothetical protein